MEFDSNKSIYLQICDAIYERILSGELGPDARIPSVREYGAEIGVNPNTVMRSFEHLQSQGVIYNKRGIGYFVSTGAIEMIRNYRKEVFMKEEAEYFFRQIYTLGLSPEDLKKMYSEYIKTQK